MASEDPDSARTYGINLATAMVIAAFRAVAWVNTIELQARIWLTFNRYTGLYFWSLLLSSLGCAFHALGFLFLDFRLIKNANAVGVMIGVSWWCMVTGQALVLYSRLHLVVRDRRKIRWVLAMIITNFFILHLPIMLLSQMAYSPVPNQNRWAKAYEIYEKLQMTGFTLQETIISGLYLYEARRILRPGTVFQKKKTTECLRHLIWVNVCIIFMDAALLATEYAGLFSIQTVFKAAIYSVKLRFEFVVLNDLMEIVGGRNASVFSQGRDYTSSDGNNTGDVQLGAVNSRAGQQSGNHYSANAGRGAGFPASGPRTKDHGGVMRTTEVQVQDTPKSGVVESQVEVHPSEHDDRTQYGEAITTSSRRRASSRASSEIEFAGKGAYPS